MSLTTAFHAPDSSLFTKRFEIKLLATKTVRIKVVVINRRDGVVVRASASQSVDLGLIPLVESFQKTLKMASIASLLGAWHLWEVVENKLASSLVVSLCKALNGTPHLYLKDR